MTLITFQDGAVVLRDGKVGTEQACCCEPEPPCNPCCPFVTWTYTRGACAGSAVSQVTNAVDADCYSYFVDEDFDCVNPLVGRDCNAEGQCNVYARVKVTCAGQDAFQDCGVECTLGAIEYQNVSTGVWGSNPVVECDCPDAFGSLTAAPFAGPDGRHVSGPSLTWVWNAALGAWLLAAPETTESANQKCQDFYDENDFLLGEGPVPPPFVGAFDGEEVTTPSCLCGL
jgi:hypothetical protein